MFSYTHYYFNLIKIIFVPMLEKEVKLFLFFKHWYKDNCCKQEDIAAFQRQRAEQGHMTALALYPGNADQRRSKCSFKTVEKICILRSLS